MPTTQDRDVAKRLGASLAAHLHDPDAFATALRDALASLADPEHLEGQQLVAPGLGRIHGVRAPLLDAIARGFLRETRHDPVGALLDISERLLRDAFLEPRWFAFDLLERTLATETEQTWQLLRRAAREAADWITVDSLAHPYAVGIAGEPYRWSELELLVYSPSRWERRLIGSTIATMTHGGPGTAGADATLASRALPILEQLIGDDEPDVQKALSWAYRSLAAEDLGATTSALRAETRLAAEADDGHRAWVIRDSLAGLAPQDADDLRTRLVGIRRRSGAPSTSTAAEAAARFGRLPDPTTHPEPPLA
ncbi:MAG: DNA alkylation repair protein [Chloroflexota bacterium]